MLYAKVVLALPIEGPFDYLIPPEAETIARPGSRVWVNFRNKKEIAYIVEITSVSDIPRIKPLIKLVDTFPVLDQAMLKFTRSIADYYYCSWGEAIAASLPEPIRKGKPIDGLSESALTQVKDPGKNLLFVDLDGQQRWELYAQEIKETLALARSTLVLVPDKNALYKARQILSSKLGLESEAMYRHQPDELEGWAKVKKGQVKVVLGTRSSIFAPLADLGLIIVDQELDSVYKQEQVPHYHARQSALIRAEQQSARLILGGTAVSLEAIQLARENKLELQVLKPKSAPAEIRIVDMKSLPLLDRRKKIILSRLLQDNMLAIIQAKGKILLFLNRKGFATAAICSTCGQPLKCPRCNINLVYYFNQAILRCHYCNYKLAVPKICPLCNSGYIKYSGAGTEKIESELARIFPQARVKRVDTGDVVLRDEADIFISTQGIIRQADFKFELTAVLGIDNSLNHVDFRSAEKAFAVLSGLLTITRNTLAIQTGLSQHYCFKALKNRDNEFFYDQELKARHQLKFPPFRHFCSLKIRGKSEPKVAQVCDQLFQKLSQAKSPKGVQVISANPADPAKLRGNYYWAILIRSFDVLALNNFLKIYLKDFRYSGIILTVDVDPV